MQKKTITTAILAIEIFFFCCG